MSNGQYGLIPKKKPTAKNDGGLMSEKDQGGWTAIELFLAGIAGWTVDTGIIENYTCRTRRRLDETVTAASFCGLRIYLAARHPICSALQSGFSNRRNVDPHQQTARPRQNRGQS